MIDIESMVFDRVSTELRNTYDGITVYGEYVESPSSFPSVNFVEADNNTSLADVTIGERKETYANLMYSVDIFSNKASGKKSEAKAIADTVDKVMTGLGFYRIMRSQTPNLDRTIYRITARYSGKVQEIIEDEDVKYLIFNK